MFWKSPLVAVRTDEVAEYREKENRFRSYLGGRINKNGWPDLGAEQKAPPSTPRFLAWVARGGRLSGRHNLEGETVQHWTQ